MKTCGEAMTLRLEAALNVWARHVAGEGGYRSHIDKALAETELLKAWREEWVEKELQSHYEQTTPEDPTPRKGEDECR